MSGNKYLSCDSLADAFNSLAIIYDLEKSAIENMYYKNWPSFLPEYGGLCELDSPIINDLLGQYLGNSMYEIRNDVSVAYYHRTRFDGNSSWFDAGLLGSENGSMTFLNNVKSLLINEGVEFNKLCELVRSNVKDRNQFEGSGAGGPYAFDSLDAAKNAPGYDSPEFLCGRFSDGDGGIFYYLSEVEEILRKNLKPVIVKFMAFPKDYVRYVNGLWRYVYSLKFDYEISQQTAMCTFSGGGRTISKEQIIDLIVDF